MPVSPATPAPLAHPVYRPDIDGLRAIAVLAVVLYHASPRWLQGGFAGVDIFFVISGYLISTIIFGSLAGKGFGYGEFYARRIRRLFPSLLAVLACTLAFGWFVLLTDEFRQLGRHVLASAAFVQNLALWAESGYFDTVAESKPLLHLWSLAVEEQFYIVWPVLLGLVWWARRRMLPWMLGAALLSFALSLVLVFRAADAAFYMPLARLWELAAGGVLAWLGLRRQAHHTTRSGQWMSVTGLLLIVAGLAFIDRHKYFPGFWALLPVLGTCLCIAAGPSAWLNRHLLGARPMVWVGLISYPLYLWHWPLLAYARVLEEGVDPPRAVRFGAVGVSVLLAWLSYRFLEKPLRHRRGWPVVAGLAGAMGVLALLGALIWAQKLPSRIDDAGVQRLVAAGSDWTFPDGMRPLEFNGQVFQTVGEGAQTVLLMGDSHVEQQAPRATELARVQGDRLNRLVFATRGACPPIPNLNEDRDPACGERMNVALRFALTPEVNTVVVGGCWSCYFDIGDVANVPGVNSSPAPDRYYYLENGQRHYLRGGDGVQKSLDALAVLLRTLKAAGKTTYLLLNMPVGDPFAPRTRLVGERWGQMSAQPVSTHAPLPASQEALHARLARIAQDSGAQIIDPLPALCTPEGQCLRAGADGTPIYKDTSHLRASYVREAAVYMDAVLLSPPAGATAPR
ncbi:acyltransferase family protein [Xenophilus arseniciresistens]|uniref:Acyltransferase family protein n=1 Tax=Xenophilus arseniciresistens TaxID=1283306 RepID=A0AAE3N842_9BURK|nr:acyltransferase family protein [Xenophilus arseniciresistens]MDA7417780.1 acyltransferase family protein [Xenophilus arseniciresistens]